MNPLFADVVDCNQLYVYTVPFPPVGTEPINELGTDEAQTACVPLIVLLATALFTVWLNADDVSFAQIPLPTITR